MSAASKPDETLLVRRGLLEFLVVELPRPHPLPSSLSAGEREVVALVIAGASNREIAAIRGTSERTVANQLRSTYRKLGVFSRAGLLAKLSASSSPQNEPRAGAVLDPPRPRAAERLAVGTPGVTRRSA